MSLIRFLLYQLTPYLKTDNSDYKTLTRTTKYFSKLSTVHCQLLLPANLKTTSQILNDSSTLSNASQSSQDHVYTETGLQTESSQQPSKQ